MIGLACLVALPALVLAVRIGGSGWLAVNADQASLLLRTWEVGTRHTPLVGAYSRYGWDHPGPLLFWVSAPGVRLFGPPGLLATAGVVNALAGAGAVLAAHRVGGWHLAVPAAVAAAVMMHALTASGLVDPWNPYVAVVPFLLYLVCVWGAANGDRILLVGAVVSGSWCVQAHLGYLPATVAAAGLAVAWRLAHHLAWERASTSDRIPRIWALGATALGLLLWLPPLVDQVVASEGNLGELYRFARSGANPADLPSEPVGWGAAFEAATGLFGLPARWMAPDDPDSYTATPHGSSLSLGLLLAAFVTVGALTWWRGHRRAAGLIAMAALLVPVSVVAMARTSEELLGYVLRWTWAVAALGWVAVGWAILEMIGPRARQIMAALAAVVVATLGIVTLGDGTASGVEDNSGIDAVEHVSDQLLDELDRDTTYKLSVIESHWYYLVIPGIAVDLLMHGQPLVVDRGLRDMVKEWRIADPDVPYSEVVFMPADAVADFRDAHPDARRVATYEPPTAGATASGLFSARHEAWLVPVPE